MSYSRERIGAARSSTAAYRGYTGLGVEAEGFEQQGAETFIEVSEMDNTVDPPEQEENTRRLVEGLEKHSEEIVGHESERSGDNILDGQSEQSDALTDFEDTDIVEDANDLFSRFFENVVLVRKSTAETFTEIQTLGANIIDEEQYDVNSDELHTASESGDSDGERGDQLRGPYFNESVGFKSDFDLVVGMQFTNPKVFRKALLYYAIRNGFDYDFVNNKNKRVNAQCRQPECPWRISASWRKYREGERVFQIKKLVEHQSCPRDFDNKKVTARFLSEYYHDILKDNSAWTVDAFRRHVKRDLRVNVSYAHCYRAKKFSKESLEGKLGEQYLILRDYCEALKKYNPGTAVHLELDGGRFKRIYVCPDACKRGFVIGCRPIISLDACHLKGSYTGQIHSAVGRDGNDNMFPIAYAICEAESKETWLWFIERLLADIGGGITNGWTFISDQQKGLGEALKELVPRSEHRLCVRHLYANFSKTFKGKELKDTMWACARATTYNTHIKAMNQLKVMDKEAFLYLEKLDKTVWCKHGFSYFALSDCLCSNISECFNAFIKDARSEPIVTCLETIRCLLMQRFVDKFRGMQKYEGDISPRIWRKLEANRHASMDCEVWTGGSDKFQVKSTQWGMYVTDLATRSCECHLWDLTGIPCVHACAAISHLGGSHNAYVHQTYSKEAFLKTYQFIIEPISGPVQWPHTTQDPILPPLYKRQSRRPKKQRRRGINEHKKTGDISRVGALIHCGRYGGEGHNQRNCKRDPKDTRRIEAAKRAAEKTNRYRQRKKQISAESAILGARAEHVEGTRPQNVIVKKAKTLRKSKESVQNKTRPSHIVDNQVIREWQRPYVNSNNAIPYIPPRQEGPILIPSRGGSSVMVRRHDTSSQTTNSRRAHPSQAL